MNLRVPAKVVQGDGAQSLCRAVDTLAGGEPVFVIVRLEARKVETTPGGDLVGVVCEITDAEPALTPTEQNELLDVLDSIRDAHGGGARLPYKD